MVDKEGWLSPHWGRAEKKREHYQLREFKAIVPVYPGQKPCHLGIRASRNTDFKKVAIGSRWQGGELYPNADTLTINLKRERRRARDLDGQ